jgi:hypothetical protein
VTEMGEKNKEVDRVLGGGMKERAECVCVCARAGERAFIQGGGGIHRSGSRSHLRRWAADGRLARSPSADRRPPAHGPVCEPCEREARQSTKRNRDAHKDAHLQLAQHVDHNAVVDGWLAVLERDNVLHDLERQAVGEMLDDRLGALELSALERQHGHWALGNHTRERQHRSTGGPHGAPADSHRERRAGCDSYRTWSSSRR